tara:strand:- start:848 stop:2047 length:1200 start_codon:yes stop_codon:yes gene_type:complete
MLKNKNILLGITASIAAYKSASLVRLFKKSGANVKVIQTPKSIDFVTPLTLSTLSENKVHYEMINKDDKTWNNHVDLGAWADLMVIAPTSAKTLSKMATGDCDNLLLATYLSATCPVYFAPAMDLDMYKHNSTKENIKKLESMSNILIPPSTGELASGLFGEGRMEEPELIISFITNDLKRKSPLNGKKVLITAGPTHEKIDKIRYISNYSSGKMGFALAKVAADLGADVVLIKGPTSNTINYNNVHVIDVISAEEMYKEVINHFSSVDIGVFAAAVSDFKPLQSMENKIKKSDGLNEIKLELTKDILNKASSIKKSNQYVVGFALETDNEIDNAIKKLEEKNLDLIILNSLNDRDAGFGFDTNKISIIDSEKNIDNFDNKTKDEVAVDIFNKILKNYK